MAKFPVPLHQRLVSKIRDIDQRLRHVEHQTDDPVAIGTALARTSISANYVPATSGWTLNSDGTGDITSDVTFNVPGGLKVSFGPAAPRQPEHG